jgi:ribonuclease HII
VAILGIDEVGRGPWAGPLVIGAVVLNGTVDGLADSKLLTKKRREELNQAILNSGASVGLGWVSAAEIDDIGLSEALRLATRRAVEQIKAPYHEVVIDGTVNFLAGTSKGRFATTLKKADQLIPAVSAASIVAKVARDAYMAELDAKYPGYGFASHVGYGTAAHRAAIEKLGPCCEHRMSFKPLSCLQEQPRTSVKAKPTTKQTGDVAETKVCEYLGAHGYEVVARNWKTKACEIDIVAQKDATLFFVEVKYRKDCERGDGLAAVTKKKLDKMKLAARMFAHANKSTGVDMRLAVASVSGNALVVDNFVVLD